MAQSAFEKKLAKAKKSMNKVARPMARKAGKATTGVGKVVSMAGYKGVGRKTSNVGRAVTKASRVKDLRSAKKAIDAAIKAGGKKK